MKTLYIDCGMGAAGDMLTAALLELIPDQEEFIDQLNTMGLSNVSFSSEQSTKCGIKGNHIVVSVYGVEESDVREHASRHTSMSDIEAILDGLRISQSVRENAKQAYRLIAEAESHVHGTAVTEIHFHEVGTLDAIADVTAVCMLMERIHPDKVVVSPIHVGSGSVKCAHGMLPVPAPATAYILQGCPIYGGEIDGELCTPTGAALLKHFATAFGDMPLMEVSGIGYGMGTKDFERANCVRIMLGESRETGDSVTELCCNIDDMTAEEIGYAMERLFEGGALEVFTVPVGMKKNRPGQLLNIICENADKEKILSIVFKHTTTLGVREHITNRYKLERRIEDVETEYGVIHKKIATGYGVERYKYEYEDLAKIAKRQGLSIAEVKQTIK